MKLSEAIREGAKLRPQIHGGPFLYWRDNLCSCALAAAAEGAGLIDPTNDPFPAQISTWAVEVALGQQFGADILSISGRTHLCPASPCNHLADSLTEIIVLLNDDHLWTREQIADWVEGQGY